MPQEGTVALVFPGQGSQSAGMGRDLYETFSSAREVFQLADEVTGFSLSKLIFQGPEENLRQTINAQPAIMTVSLACLKAVEELTGKQNMPVPAFVAGHSLGEYTALAAAGVLDFKTAIFLARRRGTLMHEAGLKNAGGMAAVLGMEETPLAAICLKTGTVIANYNSPGQLVISGAKENLANAMESAKAGGALKVVPLQVSGAFHSPLMQSAVAEMSQVISGLTFRKPVYPVVVNVTAERVTGTEEIKSELITQLTNGVRWQQSVEYMISHGVTTFIEVGPGRVLAGLIKRINKSVTVLNVSDVASVQAIAHVN